MRLLNQTITTGLKRKELPPVTYELIDSNNVRIGTKWFKYRPRIKFVFPDSAKDFLVHDYGVTIYHDPGTKQFISNSWYLDEEINNL